MTSKDGAERELPADADGVVSAALEDGVKISVVTSAGHHSLDLPLLPAPERGGVADCGDGVYVPEKAGCP